MSSEPQAVSEERLRNTRSWAAARVGMMSGAEVIIYAIDELFSARAELARLREALRQCAWMALDADDPVSRQKQDNARRLCAALTPAGGSSVDRVSDERLADLIASVESEHVVAIDTEWNKFAQQFKEDRLRALRELQQLRAGWRDIATAPRDGTPVWLYSPTHGQVEGSWECVDGGGHPENGPPIYWWTSPHCEFIDGPHDAPTHWMPRPEDPPPEERADG